MDPKFEDSETFKNLKNSFYEESGLAMRYKFFAIVAEFEGLDRYVDLFKEMAEGADCNVHGALDFLRLVKDPSSDIPIGGTNKNVESILQTEVQQYSEIYPEMAKMARKEGFTDVASWFDTLEKLKRAHVRKIKRVTNDK